MIQPELDFMSIPDKMNAQIRRFRQDLFSELGAEKTDIDLNLSHEDTSLKYSHLGRPAIEELYKFGSKKWDSVKFDVIEAAVDLRESKIIGISGATDYNGWLRIGMHHYTLLEFRKKHRALLFRKGGFLERHIKFVKESGTGDGVFFTIYPHSKNLHFFVKNMQSKRFSPEGYDVPEIKNVRSAGGPYTFNGVEQYFFYIPFGRNTFSVDQIIDAGFRPEKSGF